MSIVKMSRLHIVAPQNIRRPLLRELTRFGCVEIGNTADHLVDPQWAEVLQKLHESTDSTRVLSSFKSALETLNKYAPIKSSMLAPRRQISENDFDNQQCISEATDAAEQINNYARQIASLYAEEARLVAKKVSLVPWSPLDVPLGTEFGTRFKVIFGVSPASADPQSLIAEADLIGECDLQLVSSDREQHYYLLIAHRSVFDQVLDQLKPKGFSLTTFKDIQGTAADNIAALEANISQLADQRLALIEKIKENGNKRNFLEQGIDVLDIETQRDEVINGLAGTAKIAFLEGWYRKR